MTLSLDTAYRSFGGEVEASSTPTICRLPDSRRHQLSAIAPLGPADAGQADPDRPGNLRVATAGIGRQQNLRPLELAGSMLPAAQHRRQFVPLDLAQFDPITYIHASPPCRRPGRIQR